MARKKKTPSLLEPEARGGDVAESGLSFQEQVTLAYVPSEDWNDQLLRDLLATRDWVVQHGRPRRIRLHGNRRLSVALAIGWVFSAVAGFALEMEYRGELWATDTYATSTTPAYSLQSQFREGEGDQLIVTIGILREIASDVRRALPSLGMDRVPQLDLYGSVPIESPQHTNATVRAIKNEIAATNIFANYAETGSAGAA
jgi:SMODS-associated and fused to various effectors sensor domain